jgi:MoaA/NifB/PqqE/SkfB family radical SAM enzyme
MNGNCPAHVFLDLLVECNLRCVQCDIWKLKQPPGALTLDERREVVRQVAAWDPRIRIVLTGGELFLDRGLLYGVAASCRDHEVYATMSTNGTLLRQEDVERLPESGIRCVVLSVDSDEPEVHDRIRGVAGTFERVVGSIRRLVAARDRAGTDFTVLTSTILGRHNLDRVERMLSLFESLGVDTTLFQPIQAPFARELKREWWQDDQLFPVDPGQVARGIDDLVRLKASGRRLFQTERQFEDMRHYFATPTSLLPGQCGSMDHSLMIDVFGNARLCFHMERIGLPPVGSLRREGIRQIWESGVAELSRTTMRGCREGCGSMICHAR